MAKDPPDGVLKHFADTLVPDLRLTQRVQLRVSSFGVLGQLSNLGLQNANLVLNCKERVLKRGVAACQGSEVLRRHGGLVHQSKLLSKEGTGGEQSVSCARLAKEC